MPKYVGLSGSALSQVVGFVCGISFFLFGYSQGIIGSLLTVPSFQRRFPQLDTLNHPGDAHVATVLGITIATWNIGCFASAIVNIWLGDILGRRRTIFLGTAIWIVGEAVQCSSYSYGQFIAGRFIAGFGNGFNTATVPAWQAECTKAHRRGTILMITAGACIAAGLAFSYWMAFAFAWVDPSSAAWRAPIALQIAFALVVLALVLGLPESPRWLILTGREGEALNVLGALNNLPNDHEDVYDEFLQIKDAVLEMAGGGFSTLFTMGEYRYFHRTALAYVIQIFQQISGINLILQYMGLMFVQQTHYSGWLARLLAACSGTEYFLASFVAVVGIDHFWGRRSLMLFGATGMSLSMIVLTIMRYLDTRSSNIVTTVFVFVFNTFFAIGWQGMSWLYQVEIVPLRIRGPANALSTSANWLFNFVVVLVAPVAFNNIGYRTYIIFAATNAFIVPCVWFFYPETAYRSLEEVDVIFHSASMSPKPWLDVVKIANNEPLWFGKDGEAPFVYEQSDWHQRMLGRQSGESEKSDPATTSSDPTTSSEGGTRPLIRGPRGRTGLGRTGVYDGYAGAPAARPLGTPAASAAADSLITPEMSEKLEQLDLDLDLERGPAPAPASPVAAVYRATAVRHDHGGAGHAFAGPAVGEPAPGPHHTPGPHATETANQLDPRVGGGALPPLTPLSEEERLRFPGPGAGAAHPEQPRSNRSSQSSVVGKLAPGAVAREAGRAF